MDSSHIEDLRSLTAAYEMEAWDSNPTVDVGLFFGGVDQLHKQLGTRFIGCTSNEYMPALISLVTCIRFLGCPLLIEKTEQLNAKHFPGTIWITVLCPASKAEILKSLANNAGFQFELVHNHIYALVGTERSETMLLSLEINKLKRKPTQDRAQKEQ